MAYSETFLLTAAPLIILRQEPDGSGVHEDMMHDDWPFLAVLY